MAFPPTIGQLINTPTTKDISTFFSPNGWAYVVGEYGPDHRVHVLLHGGHVQPVDQADNPKKYGGFIPGVRPGRPTAEFLDRILARLTFPGAIYLAIVAALPTILITRRARTSTSAAPRS